MLSGVLPTRLLRLTRRVTLFVFQNRFVQSLSLSSSSSSSSEAELSGPHVSKSAKNAFAIHISPIKKVLNMLAVLVLTTLLLLGATTYVMYKPPDAVLRAIQARWTDVLFAADVPPSARIASSTSSSSSLSAETPAHTVPKLIALTIDDCPSKYTDEIADVLYEYNATATFFVIGEQVAGREHVLSHIVRMGHELGNHAMTSEPSISLEPATLAKQIRMVEQLIEGVYAQAQSEQDDGHDYDYDDHDEHDHREEFDNDHVKLNENGDQDGNVKHNRTISTATAQQGKQQGKQQKQKQKQLQPRQRQPPRFFRPGSGFFSTETRKIMTAIGYRIVLGSIYPHDAQLSNPTMNAKHILSLLRPGRIIICHDSRPWTAPMLRIVLPALKRDGWEVVHVSHLVNVYSSSFSSFSSSY